MAKRNVVDFKIINLSEEKFQELKEAGQIDPNALYTTPDESLKRNQITNCLTEIPQDIKLELNNGTLTLKAGSKVYVPNGVGAFDEVVIASDLSVTPTWLNNQSGIVYYRRANNNITVTSSDYCYSGSTAPTYAEGGVWYDTANNKIKHGISGSWVDTDESSLPIAIVKDYSNVVTNINQVFNGLGYVGSTVFALPGVKGLVPNGRNEDGSLKNTEFVISNVKTYTQQSAQTSPHYIALNAYGIGEWNSVSWMGYDADKNIVYNKNGSASATTGERLDVCICGVAEHIGTTKVTSFTTKNVFHVVDYSELNPKIVDDKISTILNLLYPVGFLYLTSYDTAGCPIAALIPGSTWELIAPGRALWTGNGSNGGSTIAAGLPNITGDFNMAMNENGAWQSEPTSGAFFTGGEGGGVGSYDVYGDNTKGRLVEFSASRSNSIYGNSTTVQPPAFVVNVWRRTA